MRTSGTRHPDAVTIATVHQAKGMQWPAVFVPAMRRNRFPSPRHGGLNVFHVIPEAAVPDADRYRGTEADEVRLFYVAVTRAQKYLHLSFSPGESTRYANPSEFFDLRYEEPVHADRRARPASEGTARAAGAARHPGGHAQLQRPEVLLRVPVRVQAPASCTASTRQCTRRSATANPCTT